MADPSSTGGRDAERRYWGKYRGFVADNQDPRRMGRVKVRVPELLGREIMTDWAATNPPYGGLPETGGFKGLPVETAVFVEFESGDVNRPLVTGTWWGQPKNGSPDPPALTRSDGRTCFKDDPSVGSPKGEDGFVSADGESQCQPASPLLVNGGPEYPLNQVLKTRNNGVTVEVDDTPGRPRVHVYLGEGSGSWLEMDKDGLSVRVNGKEYHLAEQDRSVKSKGGMHFFAEDRMTMRAARDRFLHVGGDEERTVEGERKTFVTGKESRFNQADYEHHVVGNRTTVVLGEDKLIVAGAVDYNAAGKFGIVAGGVFSVAASSISLGGGGVPATPPNPESPTPLPSQSCPPLPPKPPCPPLPASGT